MTTRSKLRPQVAEYSHLEPLCDPPREPDMQQSVCQRSVREHTVFAPIVLCILVSFVVVACVDARDDVPEIERRTQALNQSIMCPVCPGESIDQSQVALAVQMRGIVREKLAAGWSDERVRDFFVERYGPSVLLEPPTEGIGLAVWMVASLGVVVGVGAFALAVRHMRRMPVDERGDEFDDDMTDADLQGYYARIEASISKSDMNGQDDSSSS